MSRSRWKVATLAVVVFAALASPAAADRVSGTITGTYMIVEDTDLVGDVTCDVAANTACFAFAASGTELRLNGFTITGRADAATGCSGAHFPLEAGVVTNGANRVRVRGPGMIQRFRGRGVTVVGSTDARVEELTVSTTCSSGVFIAADAFGTLVEGIVSVRNGSTVVPCGGI